MATIGRGAAVVQMLGGRTMKGKRRSSRGAPCTSRCSRRTRTGRRRSSTGPGRASRTSARAGSAVGPGRRKAEQRGDAAEDGERPTCGRTRHDSAGGRARRLRHHRRPREGDDLPLALPARAARAARLPDRRRRGRRLDDRPARASARASRSRAPASRSTRRCSTASRRGSPTSRGDFADARDLRARRRRDQGDAPAPVFYLEIPPFLFGTRRQGPRRGRADEERARRRREAVRPRPRLRPGARRRAAPVHRRVAALPDRPLPREDGPRGDPLPALREHDARAGLEPQLRRVRADHDGRGLRRRGPRPLLRPGRRAARRRRQPPDAGRRRGGDGGARGRRPEHAQGREGRRCSARSPTPTPRTTCAASTTATATIDGVAAGLDDRDLRRAAARDRQLALVGRAVLHPHRQAPAGDADRAAARLQAPAAARLREPATADPSRTSSWSSSTRRPACGSSSTPTAPTRHGPEPIHARHGVRRGGRRGRRRPTRCCCTPRWSATRTRFTRQDGVEETWRIMQPLLDAPPPVQPYAPGLLGAAEAADALVAGHGRWHEPVDGVMSDGSRRRAPMPQSAAAPSPFPPIADYAFLSDCHTGALVAPDGAIDWLCVPALRLARACSAACSTARPAFFRFGAVRHQPSRPPRTYEPGTNVLVTTWKTPAGWVVVRDALTMGPRDHEDTVTPHTRPPADDDADHMLVRTVECLEGHVEVELVCEPVVRLRPRAGRVDARRRRPPPRRRDRRRPDDPPRAPTSRSASRASRVRARHVLEAGERAFCALSWAEGLATPARRRRRRARGSRRRRASGATGSAAPASPTTAGASRSSARRSRSRASPTCRPARPSRRSRPRCRRRRAASATGTTATRGCATRRSRCRRCTG